MLEPAKEQAKERAQVTAQQTAEDARTELGRLAFEVLEAYFPEEAKSRRRENSLAMLAVGVLIGFLLRHVASR